MKKIKTLVVLGAYGLSGSVRAFVYPELDKKKELYDSNGTVLKIKSLQIKKGNIAIVSFLNCTDRTAAEAIKGLVLYQNIELDSCEFLISDLVGRKVKISDKEAVISNVVNYGAGDIIELIYNEKKVVIPCQRVFFSPGDGDHAFYVDETIFLSFYNL